MLLPLYVDLDGTLVATDTLWESMVTFVKQHPMQAWRLLWWVRRGRAGFKAALASGVKVDPEGLPYRKEVVEYIQDRKKQGGRVMLATAAHQTIADAIALHLNCFDGIIATKDDGVNMAGKIKAHAIRSHAGGDFAYLGDHMIDIPVWRDAQECILLSTSQRKSEKLVKSLGRPFDYVIESVAESFLMVLPKALRIHQWVKNILLFIPIILAHHLDDGLAWQKTGIGFLAFGCAASSTYLLNDLLDISADRRHLRKRHRPLAAGLLSIPTALMLASIGLVLSFMIGALGVSWLFGVMIIGYTGTSIAYSTRLKRYPVIDVLMLAFFYVYRLVAGAVAADIYLTTWLLAFAAFLFVSLGCLKRVGELTLWHATKSSQPMKNGRGYVAEDLLMVAMFGVNAGFLSLLVLALYLNSAEVVTLYRSPFMLWGVVAVFLYWLMRVWLLTWRGEMHDDPVLFALRDRASRWAGIVVLIFVLSAF
jgi:4-hydroxybenzoate polyprenyltransferase/phosphoglycolate phosphatase-like HAD superfamily hydrolase